MRIVGQFPRAVREVEHFTITLSDGVRLAARLWLPGDAEAHPVPAILEYLPYRKRDGTTARDEITHPYIAGHGYACLRVDIRGNGESDGLMEDEYTAQELADGVEVIEWIARQPWCTGKVGVVGISWGGFNGLQLAHLAPAPLKAVITLCSTDDRYADDIHYAGGCLLTDNLGWSSQMLAYSSRPPDPALVGDRWREMWLHRLENMPLLLEPWLTHQRRDAFWKHGSVCEDYGRIAAAVYAVGGWADAYSNTVPRLLAGLKAPVKGLVGPWEHKYPHMGRPGPAIGFLQEMLRWWDQWLKGVDTGIMAEPRYRAYMLESVRPSGDYAERAGRWVAEESWPSPAIAWRGFALDPGRLSPEAAGGPEQALTLASPQSTGLAGGRFCPGMMLAMEHPLDQRPDDAGSLVFDSAPLDQRLEILGAPTLELELAVDRPSAFLAVRLCDVHPDGASTRVTYGLLNLTHRDGHERPEPLKPGERLRVCLALNDIAYAFPPGHRLRVAVSTAYWPMVWPSPEAVTLTLFTGASRLRLPVRPPREDGLRDFEPVEIAPPETLEELRPARASRRIEQDVGAGSVVLRTLDDLGRHRHPVTGIESGSSITQVFTIRPDDPAAARMRSDWTIEVGRGDWQTRTESSTEMWSDRDNFYLRAWLEAYEGDTRVFRKDWEKTIARDGV